MVSVRTRPVVIALVAVLAIALAAGTLNTAVTHDDGIGAGSQGGFGGSAGGEGQQAGDEGDPPSVGFDGFGGAVPIIPLPCYPVLNEPWFLGGAGLVAAGGLFVLYRRKGSLVPIGIVAGIGPPLWLIHALLTACRAADELRISLPLSNRTANESASFALTGGSGGGGAAAGGVPLVSVAFIGLLGLALIVAVALLFQASGDDEPAAVEADPPDRNQIAAIGRAAGRAADRIEADADPDNAVYRAWKEMTDLLDVPNSESSTPAKFAAVAVEAGMDGDDVAELTSLFETVRYGTAAPTEERESRAVAALRRIEDGYAGGDR